MTAESRNRRRNDEGGVALLIVVMVIALITTVVTELAYNSKVELMAAQNFKDELRAQYMLRSSAELSRLLFKIQEKVVEPAARMVGDLQVPHYAPYLIGAFTEKEQGDSLASLLGVDTSGAKGLGIEGGTVEAEVDAEDGKVNLNCASGNASATVQGKVAVELAALLAPAQFNPLFERADAEGEHHDRAEIVQALIDWADADELRYGTTGAAEDYGYESERVPYRARNGPYDTPGEIRMVRGVDDDFVHIFGDALTIWGKSDCRVNINEASPLVLWLLIVQTAENPEEFQNQARVLEALQLAVYLYDMRTLFGTGFSDLGQVIKAIESPDSIALPEIPGMPAMPAPPQGIAIKDSAFKGMAKTGKRNIWRLKASADVGRVHRQLQAVWDMSATSQVARNTGAWVYWREE